MKAQEIPEKMESLEASVTGKTFPEKEKMEEIICYGRKWEIKIVSLGYQEWKMKNKDQPLICIITYWDEKNGNEKLRIYYNHYMIFIKNLHMEWTIMPIPTISLLVTNSF